MDLFGILPIPQNFWPKDPKDIFTAYVYKSIALMNKLKKIKCYYGLFFRVFRFLRTLSITLILDERKCIA